MPSERDLESAAYDPFVHIKLGVLRRFERLKGAFGMGEREEVPSTISLIGIDGTVAFLPIEPESPSPVPGMSTITIDNADGTPGTRFWVRATDGEADSI